MTLDRRIDSFIGGADSAPEPQPDLQELLAAPQPDFEPVQVAGLGKVKALLEPLLKKGAKSAPEIKIAEPAPVEPLAPQTVPIVAPAPVKPNIPIAPLDKLNAVMKARETAIVDDAMGVKPAAGKPPERPFNTEVYDDASFAATVNVVADAAGIDYQKMTVRQIYKQALAQGIPDGMVERMLRGLPMNSTVGDNGLALNVARTLTVWDESGKQLDGMLAKAAAGELDDAGKLELRKQLSVHEILGHSVKGVQVDVARTQNVFKRVRDAGPQLGAKERAALLAELGGDDDLLRLATAYMKSPTRAGKNLLVEKGMLGKATEAIFHIAQSNMLNDVSTYAVNAGSSMVFGPLMPLARLAATAVGRVRTLVPGSNPDRYKMEDSYATAYGFMNMLSDGWTLASRELKSGISGQAGLKADKTARVNPITAEYWSDTPLKMFGTEVWRTPDLKDTPAAKVIDGLAVLQHVPFKVLSTTDEFFGGMAARWQLHSEAWTFANHEYDRLIATGINEVDATKEVQRQVAQLLTERPAEMQASIDAFRKQVTFQTDLADYKNVPTGAFYDWTAKALENPVLKPLQMFVRTLSNIWIEGTAFTPVLNFISPRFYQDFIAGGRQRDLAVGRLALGGSAMLTAGGMSWNNRCTGFGPSQIEDRKALERLGWQPYSCALDVDEISPKNIERLSQITKVSVGEHKVYVSYARFEPASFVFAAGADLADAAKFHRGGEWDEDAGEIFKVGAASLSNYMTNLPLMQFVGEMFKIGSSRMDDKGEKFVQILDAAAKQYGNVLLTGLPVVGLANSSLVAHAERMLSPARSNTMPDKADVPFGQKAYYENLQRLRSRIPFISDSVPTGLDSLGRPDFATTAGSQERAAAWINWWPLTAKSGKRSEADEVLAALDFGVNEPARRWDGVSLSATQFNRYKQLYGQEIKLEHAFGEPAMNLEQAIPYQLKEWEFIQEQAGEVVAKGDQQKFIIELIETYRKLAKLRMIGDKDGGMVPGDELGLHDDRIEFDDLRKLINRNKNKDRIHGR